MQYKICVRIKSGEYVEALDPSRTRRAVLHLTTIEDFQTAAEIPLYLVSGSERTPLATLNAERLSPLSSEECRLDLETRLLGRHRAEFRVVQNGRLVLTETLKVPPPGDGRIRAAAAILAGAAALALLVLLVIRGCAADPDSGKAGARSEKPAAAPVEPPVRAPAAPAIPVPAEGSASAAQGAAPEAAAISAAPQTAPPSAPAASPSPTDPLAAAREAFRALGEETLTIYFPADSAEIPRDQRDKLGKAAALLIRYPELYVRISGHCATAGTERGRMVLSQDRARAVYAALAAAGWKPASAPEVRGFGDERPATRAVGEQALNRRVEIRPVP